MERDIFVHQPAVLMRFGDTAHIFFDLDRTLWDFERNSAETLRELFDGLKLGHAGIPDAEAFVRLYIEKNDLCWALYRENKISKDRLRTERFVLALAAFGIHDDALALELAETYVERSPLKTGLLPHTLETLAYLAKKYTLHIITNGFEEVQHIKLKQSGLEPYFKTVTTSERAGCKKPDAQIFRHALAVAGAYTFNSLMVGDDFAVDVAGALAAGLKAIHFAPDPNVLTPQGVPRIYDLQELRQWL